MASGIHKLSAMAVAKATAPGRLSDGGNLYLRISTQGVKSWVFMYQIGGTREARGRQRELGLGPLHTVSLAQARDKAAEYRKMLVDGLDPMASRMQERLDRARTITFDKAAEEYIAIHQAGWKNEKHVDQWRNTLATYCSPHIGKLSVAAVDTELVLKCLNPIWNSKTETATRLRGRMEKILDWATSKKYRTGENPARWKGHLEHSLAAPSKIQKIEHHAALPYAEVGAFLKQLQIREGYAARCLEFTILTAVRSGESRGAAWGEFDLDAAIWTIPPERMKMKKEHRVPLSKRALDILQDLKKAVGEVTPATLVFPSQKEGKTLSDMTLGAVLKRMERSDLTTHGFRSTFRDWAAETTNYPREVAEMALAHAIGDKVEAAYRRGDLFKKRTRMMNDWAAYCATVREKAENVIPIQGSKTAA